MFALEIVGENFCVSTEFGPFLGAPSGLEISCMVSGYSELTLVLREHLNCFWSFLCVFSVEMRPSIKRVLFMKVLLIKEFGFKCNKSVNIIVSI